MRAISTPCILTSLRSRADGSLGLSFSTPELTAEEKTVWFQLQNRNCKMLLEPQDVEVEPPVEVKGKLDHKTCSQQLRGVLYVFWQQQGSAGDFEVFYRSKMSQFIESVKSKLDP